MGQKEEVEVEKRPFQAKRAAREDHREDNDTETDVEEPDIPETEEGEKQQLEEEEKWLEEEEEQKEEVGHHAELQQQKKQEDGCCLMWEWKETRSCEAAVLHHCSWRLFLTKRVQAVVLVVVLGNARQSAFFGLQWQRYCNCTHTQQ